MPFAHLPFARPKAEPHFLSSFPLLTVLSLRAYNVCGSLYPTPHLSNPNVLLTSWDQVKKMMGEKDVYLGGMYVESAKKW